MMNFFKTRQQVIISCLIVVTLALVQISHAQDSPQDYLDVHNAPRSALGVENLEWDDVIATYAQEFADTNNCAFEFSHGPYGENIVIGEYPTGVATIEWIVEGKAEYDHDTNTCTDAGTRCEAYINVVSRNTVRLGCGRVLCDNNTSFTICNYDPPTNFPAERPY